ncbi:hypothetical protein ACJX0J_008796, partial [Zea mays]
MNFIQYFLYVDIVPKILKLEERTTPFEKDRSNSKTTIAYITIASGFYTHIWGQTNTKKVYLRALLSRQELKKYFYTGSFEESMNLVIICIDESLIHFIFHMIILPTALGLISTQQTSLVRYTFSCIKIGSKHYKNDTYSPVITFMSV